MKAMVGNVGLHAPDMVPGNAEAEQAEREINQVAFSEQLDERIAAICIGAHLVVHVDHTGNFFSPRLPPRLGQVSACVGDLRWNVVQRLVRPQTDIVKAGRDG